MQPDPIQDRTVTLAELSPTIAVDHFAGDLRHATKDELVCELHLAIDDLAAAATPQDLVEQRERLNHLLEWAGHEALPNWTPVPNRRAFELADGAVAMFLEYRDVHGYGEEAARSLAVSEVMEGERARAEVPWPVPEPTWSSNLGAEPERGWTR
jgi:hypothetical protein